MQQTNTFLCLNLKITPCLLSHTLLLADDIFDEMVSRNVGEYRYPLGGKLYVFNKNENIGFIKGHMCSPAIATQAEDLIAGGVKECV